MMFLLELVQLFVKEMNIGDNSIVVQEELLLKNIPKK